MWLTNCWNDWTVWIVDLFATMIFSWHNDSDSKLCSLPSECFRGLLWQSVSSHGCLWSQWPFLDKTQAARRTGHFLPQVRSAGNVFWVLTMLPWACFLGLSLPHWVNMLFNHWNSRPNEAVINSHHVFLGQSFGCWAAMTSGWVLRWCVTPSTMSCWRGFPLSLIWSRM